MPQDCRRMQALPLPIRSIQLVVVICVFPQAAHTVCVLLKLYYLQCLCDALLFFWGGGGHSPRREHIIIQRQRTEGGEGGGRGGRGGAGCLARFRARRRHVLAAKEVYDHLNKEHLYSEFT